MYESSANPVQLFLPLLAHADERVRRQAGLLLLAIFGSRGLTYLRRTLEDPDLQVRQQTLTALETIADVGDIDIIAHPRRPMYVECLGGLHVYIDNHEIQPQEWMQSSAGRAGGRKARDLFAYLVHCGWHGASRKEATLAVWGASERPTGLARTLTTLRQLLAQVGGEDFAVRALLVEGGHCALSPEVYHTDVQLFERIFDLASKTEETRDLTAALPLYRQVLQLYGGLYMADVAWGKDWAQERRDRLKNSFVIAAERLAEHSYTQEQDQQCIAFCRRALDVDASADDISIWLLRAYARLGMWGELERSFRRYTRITGIEPQSKDGQSDPVVREYQALVHGLAHDIHRNIM